MQKIKEDRRQINIWLPVELVEKVDRAALAMGVATGRRVTRRDVVERSLWQWLNLPAKKRHG